MKLAGTVAESWLLELTVVVKATPFQPTYEALWKLAPINVIWNAPVPAITEEGLSVETEGVTGCAVATHDNIAMQERSR
jgi:hypothetical protein